MKAAFYLASLFFATFAAATVTVAAGASAVLLLGGGVSLAFAVLSHNDVEWDDE